MPFGVVFRKARSVGQLLQCQAFFGAAANRRTADGFTLVGRQRKAPYRCHNFK